MLSVGTVAPDFSATLDDGTPFRLSDQRGLTNVVLYFYPKAFTGGCTAEACAFRDNYDAISDYDAMIIGVSPDSIDSQSRFREKYSLGFPLIGDPSKDLLRTYDTLGFMGLVRQRVTYVIDKAGVIRAAFRHEVAIGRHVNDVLDALRLIEPKAA
jgi:peroxiredoxin Q/BCP